MAITRTVTYGKKTPAGNFIFSETAQKAEGDVYIGTGCPGENRLQSNLNKIGITADVPLEKVKIRTQRSYYSSRIESLSKAVRNALAQIGVTTIGELLTRRKDDKVKEILKNNYCDEARAWIIALAQALPHVVNPDFVIPEYIKIDGVTVEGKLANDLRDLDKDVRDQLTGNIQAMIVHRLPELIANAHEDYLRRREAELESQLAKVRCKLKGGQDC